MKDYDVSVPFSKRTTRFILKEMLKDEHYRFRGEVADDSFRFLWRDWRSYCTCRISLNGEYTENAYGTCIRIHAQRSLLDKIGLALLASVLLAVLLFLFTPAFPDSVEALLIFFVSALLCTGGEHAVFCRSRKKAVLSFMEYFEKQKRENVS